VARYTNQKLLAILLLTVLAAGTRWWLIRMQDADQKAGSLPDARSEYTLDNFDLLVMNKQGLPSFQIESPRLERVPNDGSAIVEKPLMHLFENGNRTWRIDAESGWVRQDGEEILLQGKVLMSKGKAQEQIVVHARDLTLYPQKELAQSSEPVQISRPGTVMAGVGLKARLDLEKFELLSEVKGRYEPPKPE
jgi:lipopolysaccharide export system protein LptC